MSEAVISCHPLRVSRNSPAQQVQGHLHSERSNALAIAQKLPVCHRTAGSIGQTHVHHAYRDLVVGDIGTGRARDGQRVGGIGATAGAQGHFCMMMRGVEKQHSGAMTSAMLGASGIAKIRATSSCR